MLRAAWVVAVGSTGRTVYSMARAEEPSRSCCWFRWVCRRLCPSIQSIRQQLRREAVGGDCYGMIRAAIAGAPHASTKAVIPGQSAVQKQVHLEPGQWHRQSPLLCSLLNNRLRRGQLSRDMQRGPALLYVCSTVNEEEERVGLRKRP